MGRDASIPGFSRRSAFAAAKPHTLSRKEPKSTHPCEDSETTTDCERRGFGPNQPKRGVATIAYN